MEDVKHIRGHELIKSGRPVKTVVDTKMSGYYSQNYICKRCSCVYIDWVISEKMPLCKNMKVQKSIWDWFKSLFK